MPLSPELQDRAVRAEVLDPGGVLQSVELKVENLGRTLAAGGVIVHVSDELYGGELTLPDKAPPRRISLPFVVKAWKRQLEPQCLVDQLACSDQAAKGWIFTAQRERAQHELRGAQVGNRPRLNP